MALFQEISLVASFLLLAVQGLVTKQHAPTEPPVIPELAKDIDVQLCTNMPTKVALVGSAVAAGRGSDAEHAWSKLFGDELQNHHLNLENDAQATPWNSDINYWFDVAKNRQSDLEWQMPEFAVVVFAVSPDEDGLADMTDEKEIMQAAENFVKKVEFIVGTARQYMCRQSRIVLTGPMPNSLYAKAHYPALMKVKAALKSLSQKYSGGFLDFLSPTVSDANAHWKDGLSNDDLNPNREGHAELAKVVTDNLPALLGSWYRPQESEIHSEEETEADFRRLAASRDYLRYGQ